MYAAAFRQLQAENVRPASKVEALRELNSIPTRAHWPRAALLSETLRLISTASEDTLIDASQLDPYWQFLTTCVEQHQVQAHHVSEIIRYASRMLSRVSPNNSALFGCLLVTVSEWKLHLPQKESTELLVAMLEIMASSQSEVISREYKVIVRSLCYSQIRAEGTDVNPPDPIRRLQNFVHHLMLPFSKLKTGERQIGMIMLRLFLHDCCALGEKRLLALFSQNSAIVSRGADLFTSSILLPISPLLIYGSSPVKRHKKRHHHLVVQDTSVDSQTVAFALSVLSLCLKHALQQDMQQVLEAILKLFERVSQRRLLKSQDGIDNTSTDVFRALPSSILLDLTSAISTYRSSTNTTSTMQCLALESLSAISLAAGHLPDLQRHLLKEVFASAGCMRLTRGKEKLIIHIFQASSSRTQLPELFKALAPFLTSLDEQTAYLFCSREVLGKLAATTMALPRTHSATCLELLLSVSEDAHPVVFVIASAMMEAVPSVDFDLSFAVAVKFLHLNGQRTSDDTYTAMKLYLTGTLIITKYRQCRTISLRDFAGVTKWLDGRYDEGLANENWRNYFVCKMESLSSSLGVQTRIAIMRLNDILLHLQQLQENVKSSGIVDLGSTSLPKEVRKDFGDPSEFINLQHPEDRYLPQVMFGNSAQCRLHPRNG